MEIRTVALLGAGAIGAYFIPGLSLVLGQNFCVIAEGERADRLKENGIVVNGKQYYPQVLSAEEAGAKGIDLLLVATKYNGLFDALDDIRTIVQMGIVTGRDLADPAGTMVVSTLNGIDSEEIIGKVIGPQRVINGLMKMNSERSGNEVVIDARGCEGLIFGEQGTSEKTERCEAIETLLNTAGIKCRFTGDIVTEQWQKFELNISNNLPQAVFGVGFGSYTDSRHMGYLHDCLAYEVVVTAAKHGIKIKFEQNIRGRARADARFSTLQDLDAGRETEIEMLAGVLMDKAQEVDVPVPFTEYTYHAIKILEEKNAGLFDYE